jgi:hypothetical protein
MKNALILHASLDATTTDLPPSLTYVLFIYKKKPWYEMRLVTLQIPKNE